MASFFLNTISMDIQIFQLRNPRTFRRDVKVYVLGQNGKLNDQICRFTTEHLVNEKLRKTVARKKNAEYRTGVPEVVDALLRDSGYGKDFYLQGDEEGKRKLTPLDFSEKKRELVALTRLLDEAKVAYPSDATPKQLVAIYSRYLESQGAEKIVDKGVDSVPHDQKDVLAEHDQLKESLRKKYEEDYGEPIPDIVKDDVAFLSALSDDDFDAKSYIDNKIAEEGENGDELPTDKETLIKLYVEKHKKNPPNAKKNDLDWLKSQLK